MAPLFTLAPYLIHSFGFILYRGLRPPTLGFTIYIINNWARFISEIKPVLEYIYIGLYIDKIIGYKTVMVIINTPKGKEQIQFLKVVYILGFYTSLVCL